MDVFFWTVLDAEAFPIFVSKVIKRLQEFPRCNVVYIKNFNASSLSSIHWEIRKFSASSQFNRKRRHIHVIWPGRGDAGDSCLTNFRLDLNRIIQFFKGSGHFLFTLMPYKRATYDSSEYFSGFFQSEMKRKLSYSNMEFYQFENLPLLDCPQVNFPGIRNQREVYFTENNCLNEYGWLVACDRFISDIKERIVLMST